MEPLTENKVVLVTRFTRLDELIIRFNTIEQAKFYVEHLGADFSDYLEEDRNYKQALKAVEKSIYESARIQKINRSYLPNFLFGKKDIIIVLGQDGLMANTIKYTNGQPIIGINPDLKRWDGVLLPFEPSNTKQILLEVFKKKRSVKNVTMAKATLNTGEELLAVNDFFIGPRSHVSAQYIIELAGKKEHQSSSGIIISTGLGSSGWLKSLLTGATSITNSLSPKKINIQPKHIIPWDCDYLHYTVREPYPSKISFASLVFGKITNKNPLTVYSQMPEHGVIFSDGVESDFLKFNSGSQVTITLAERQGRIVV